MRQTGEGYRQGRETDRGGRQTGEGDRQGREGDRRGRQPGKGGTKKERKGWMEYKTVI